MQAGVRELHLGLDAGRVEEAAPAGASADVVQQRGLPDPRLAAQDQDTALPGPGARDQAVQSLTLAGATEEPHAHVGTLIGTLSSAPTRTAPRVPSRTPVVAPGTD